MMPAPLNSRPGGRRGNCVPRWNGIPHRELLRGMVYGGEPTMHRNVTAIYRTYAVADLVRQRLHELGISDRHVRVIPDRDEAVGASGHRDDDRYVDQLHDLQLPDDDLRTYQHSVRRGDYVVSVEIDDDDKLGPVQEAMRRPEAETYDFDRRSAEFRDEAMIARSGPERSLADDYLAEPDPDYVDPYTRGYRRRGPLDV